MEKIIKELVRDLKAIGWKVDGDIHQSNDVFYLNLTNDKEEGLHIEYYVNGFDEDET